MHARGGMIRVRPQSFGQSENLQAHGLPVTGNIDCRWPASNLYMKVSNRSEPPSVSRNDQSVHKTRTRRASSTRTKPTWGALAAGFATVVEADVTRPAAAYVCGACPVRATPPIAAGRALLPRGWMPDFACI